MKKGFKQFLIFCGAFFIFAPLFISAQEVSITLKEKQSINLLNIIRQHPLSTAQFDFFNQSFYNPNSNFPAKTGAVALVKQTILESNLDYWFVKMSVAFSKKFIKAVYKLLPLVAYGDFSGAIDLIEKYTVEQANEYINNWLKENEVQIGSGIGKYAFPSYQDNPQSINIPYIIVYSPLDANKAKIVVEFYSKTAIEPPIGTNPNALGSKQENPKTNCWPWDIWLQSEYNKTSKTPNKIEPFIMRVKGSVVKDQSTGQYSWDTSAGEPVVEVDFDNPVPEIDQSDIILAEYAKEQQKSWFQKNILDQVDNFGKTAGKTSKNLYEAINKGFNSLKSQITKIINDLKGLTDKGGANIASSVPGFNITQEAIQSLQKIEPEIENSLENLSKENPESPSNNLINQYDDIAEQADLIISQANQILSQSSSTQQTSSELLIPLATTSEPQVATSSQDNEEEIETSTTPANVKLCEINDTAQPAQKDVVINEIAWMGTKLSSSDEWIELKNVKNFSKNLSGWQLLNKKQTIKIVFPENFNLTPSGFALLERTDDNTVSNIKADLIYSGSLANSKDGLYLFDENCVLQDKINGNPIWLAGNNTSKRTLERKTIGSSFDFQNSLDAEGTPKMPNSIGYLTSGNSGSSASGNSQTPQPNPENPTSTPTTTPTTTPTSSPSTTQPTQLATSLVISEIQLQENEFIELFNPTQQQIDLSPYYFAYYSSQRNWNNPYRIKQFPQNALIASNSYYLIGLLGFSATSTPAQSDWQPYQTGQLGNTAGSIGIFSCNPSIATSSTTSLEQAILQSQTCKIDAAGWGNSIVNETTSTQASPAENSLNRKQNSQGFYFDSDNNLIDFEINLPSPTLSTTSQPTSTPTTTPTSTLPDLIPLPAITNLQTAPSPTRGSITLLWTQNQASSYEIKYSETEITSSTWDTAISLNTSALSTSSPTNILFFNTPAIFDSQKLYYFAIKSVSSEGAISEISNIAKGRALAGFANNNDGTITDNLTGLMWVSDANSEGAFLGAKESQDEALNFITNLSTTGFAGYSDWRLPSYIELGQLVDFTKQSGPMINSGFSNIKQDCYWTGGHSTYIIGGYPVEIMHTRWFVDFSSGSVDTTRNGMCYILPVRDIPQKCNQSFMPNQDGTIADLCRNILWDGNNANIGYYDPSMGGIPAGVRWDVAFNYANSLPEENGSKWRLPTLPEIQTFQGQHPTYSNVYWSQTQTSNNPENFWALFKANDPGITRALPYISGYYVRLVKDIY